MVLGVVAVDVKIFWGHCGVDAGVVQLALDLHKLSDFIAVGCFTICCRGVFLSRYDRSVFLLSQSGLHERSRI